MFDQIFLSPQVKCCGIITYNYGIYKLPHELPNDLKLNSMIAQCPVSPPKVLLILKENSWKIEVKVFPLCTISRES